MKTWKVLLRGENIEDNVPLKGEGNVTPHFNPLINL
jgi:hypothetical protein